MAPWTFALLSLVAVPAVALTFDRLRERPKPVPVRVRRGPAGEAGRRAG